MGADIMRPLTAAEGIAAERRADYIKPNDRLTSVDRLEIYNRQYWFRVLDSLYEDFPGCLRFSDSGRSTAWRSPTSPIVLRGPSRCAILARGWKNGWSSTRNLRAGPRACRSDMVRLEWAHIEAFDRSGREAP